MVQVSRRSGFTDSALVRSLARLTDVNVPESKKSFSDQLSQWLSWTDAIALYSALNGTPAPAAFNGSTSTTAEAADCAQMRTTLVNVMAQDSTFLRAGFADPDADFAPYRRRYLARQQVMAGRIALLRGRLRARLAARSPGMAQLAALDAVMEQALEAHQHRLLSTVPALLERHFNRLRLAEQSRQAAATNFESDSEVEPATWWDEFDSDMRAVSLAELETRLQPLQGLLEALQKNLARTQ